MLFRSCDAAFAFKVKKDKSKKVKINWTELQKGDIIKVLGGGPVWKNSSEDFSALLVIEDEEVEESNKIRMGYRGKYSVVSLDKNGIIAYGIEKNSGYCHIWMGAEKVTEGLVKRPHRIVKIKCQSTHT